MTATATETVADTGTGWVPMAHFHCPVCNPEDEAPRGICGAPILGIPAAGSEHEYCKKCQELEEGHYEHIWGPE